MCKQNVNFSWNSKCSTRKCDISRNQPHLSTSASWTGHIVVFYWFGTRLIYAARIRWTIQTWHPFGTKIVKIWSPNRRGIARCNAITLEAQRSTNHFGLMDPGACVRMTFHFATSSRGTFRKWNSNTSGQDDFDRISNYIVLEIENRAQQSKTYRL